MLVGDAAAPDEALVNDSARADVEQALGALAPREAEVVRLYFGIGQEQPLTLDEIGQRYGLTRERVRQIKERALRRLRQAGRREALEQHT